MKNTNRDRQWDSLFMVFARDVGEMSYGVRLRVGAVAVRDRRVIAIGYNGTPQGEDNCCEIQDEYGNLTTKSTVIHAEANLAKYAEENHIDLAGCTLYVTHSPCRNCGGLIISKDFKEVVYGKQYRDISILGELIKEGIVCREFN